jgi:hypothetical protein
MQHQSYFGCCVKYFAQGKTERIWYAAADGVSCRRANESFSPNVLIHSTHNDTLEKPCRLGKCDTATADYPCQGGRQQTKSGAG